MVYLKLLFYFSILLLFKIIILIYYVYSILQLLNSNKNLYIVREYIKCIWKNFSKWHKKSHVCQLFYFWILIFIQL